MTELTIIPKISDKTARFKGTVAAGEHVAVTIKGGAAWLGDGNGEYLSLRVLDLVTGRTLAVFPRPPETLDEGEKQDKWDTAGEDDTDLFCNLNLNTDRMVNAARHMLRVPVLFVLGAKDEDNPATTRTLYFRDRYEVEFWPERVGDDTPYDLDKWPKQIDEWTQLVADWNARLDRMKLAAQRSTDEPPPADVPYTTITLNSGADDETDTVVKVYDGENGRDGQDGETTHAWVEERFLALAGGTMVGDIVFPVSSGQQSITAGSGGVVVTDGTKSYEFTASGNSTGNNTVARLSDVATRYEKPQGGIPASDLAGGIPKTALAAAVQTSLGKADTALQASDITGKADKATTYTKAEVDAIVAALKTGSRQIVASLSDVTSPQPLVIYMVAKSESQTSNAYDEFIWVDVNGVGRWEKIGDTEIDLSGYVQKEVGKGLSTNDYTAADKTKLAGIAAGAQVNVIETVKVNGTALTPSSKAVNIEIVQAQADWNETSSSSSSFIKNKPTVPEPLPVYGDNPLMDGTALPGTGTAYALGDHRHPTDTSRQAKITASGILKGDGRGGVTAAVAGTDYQAPLSAYTSTPSAPTASGSAGSSTAYAKGDHAHPAETLVVTGTIEPTSQDFSTFMVTNLSHTFAAAVAAVASGRGAEVNFTIQLDATDVFTITVPLVLTGIYSGAVETLRFASVFYDYLPVDPTRAFPYLARGIWYEHAFFGTIKTLVEQGDDIDMGGGGDSSDPGTLEDSAAIIFHGPDGVAYQIAFGALGAGFGVYRIDSNDNVVMVNPLDGSGYLYPMKTLTTPGAAGYEPGDHEVSRIPISDGTQYIAAVMPAASVINGARDFVVDIDNTQNSDDVAVEPLGIGTDFMLLLPAGKTAYDIAYVEAGKYARLYFSETALEYYGMPFIAAHRLDLEPLLSI